MKAESPSKKAPVVVAALPLAYREGADEYDGIMRYLYEKNVAWDLRVVRHSFSTELFRDFIPAEELSGVIMGLDYRPGIVNYCPYAPVEALDFMEKRGIPVVTLDFPPDIAESRKHGRLSFLEIDSEAIGREAAHYFAKAGEYASYGFVGAFEDKNWSRNRGAFFAKELRLLGRRNVRIFHGGDLAGWLGALLKPAAVFASNDWCADRVLKTCAQAGLRVPEDLSVLWTTTRSSACTRRRRFQACIPTSRRRATRRRR